MSQILIVTRNRLAPIVFSRPLSLANVAFGRGRGGRPAPERPVEENRVPQVQKINSSEGRQEIWTSYELPGNPRRLYQAWPRQPVYKKTGSETGFVAQNLDRLLDRDF
jgi:hypothetical protein